MSELVKEVALAIRREVFGNPKDISNAAKAAINVIKAKLLSDEVVIAACVANNINFPTMICINGMEAALTAAIAKLESE